MPSSASNAASAVAELVHQRVVQRVELLRPVQRDQADAAAGFGEDVLVCHVLAPCQPVLSAPDDRPRGFAEVDRVRPHRDQRVALRDERLCLRRRADVDAERAAGPLAGLGDARDRGEDLRVLDLAEPAHAAGEIVRADEHRVDAVDRDDRVDRLDRGDVLALDAPRRSRRSRCGRSAGSRTRTLARAPAPRRARRAAGTCRTRRSTFACCAVLTIGTTTPAAPMSSAFFSVASPPSGTRTMHGTREAWSRACAAGSRARRARCRRTASRARRRTALPRPRRRQGDDRAEQQLAPPQAIGERPTLAGRRSSRAALLVRPERQHVRRAGAAGDPARPR